MPFCISVRYSVNVNERFKIHPFWFLLKLLNDHRVQYLTQEEIAKIIIIEAEDESDKCYERIVSRLIEFRSFGDACLEKDFALKYTSSKGNVNFDNPFAHLLDIANTIANWLEYTQLVIRENSQLQILPERVEEVTQIVCRPMPFIGRPYEHEFFQRRYGLDTKHIKDTRNLLATRTVTPFVIAEIRVKKIFIGTALKEPIGAITPTLIERIAEQSGIKSSIVAEVLQKHFPHGSIGAFMANYFEMAFSGREQCRQFEEATANIFREIFKFNSTWLGSAASGREVPDILLVSDNVGFQAIIDTKAYSRYDLPSTHRDRMIYHYLPDIRHYSTSKLPLEFFSYIAGGFSNTISNPLNEVIRASHVNGSAMPVTVFIKMVENNSIKPYNHTNISKIFSLNKIISLTDIC